MKNPKTIENYLRRKMRLEALLAVVQRKGDLIKIVCTASYRKRVENLISHFSLTSEQAQYLLNADVGFLMDSEYEDVQKKYNQVVAYLAKHNNDTSIMSKNYTKGRWAHLAKYAEEKGLRCGGLYKGRAYSHILFAEDEEQKKEAIQLNLLKDVKADMLSNTHTDAHHLNSSQILCYNFFRPLIDNANGSPKLVEKLQNFGVDIATISECKFEHNDGKGDGTEFDFYIKGKNSKGADTKVFIEVKYTEASLRCSEAFSPKTRARYERKYNGVYQTLFKSQRCLKEIPSYNEFYTYYQCFRNVLRVENENTYSIFLYPSKNEIAKKFCEFKDFLADSEENKLYGSNVLFVNWYDKDIVDRNSELYEKYFAE